MTRDEFHEAFETAGPVVLPVIHVLDAARTEENIAVLVGEGARGCFLINHDFGVGEFLPILRAVRAAWPTLWMGVNFLAVGGAEAFPILADLGHDGCPIDAYWADDARIDERRASQAEAEEADRVRAGSGWTGHYFGGTAFKKQRPVAPADWSSAARLAGGFMDVVTTSGVATGEEADLAKIAAFRAGIGDTPLALASGVTPENARDYAEVDCFMVATGINKPGNFYDIEKARLAALLAVAHDMGRQRI